MYSAPTLPPRRRPQANPSPSLQQSGSNGEESGMMDKILAVLCCEPRHNQVELALPPEDQRPRQRSTSPTAPAPRGRTPPAMVDPLAVCVTREEDPRDPWRAALADGVVMQSPAKRKQDAELVQRAEQGFPNFVNGSWRSPHMTGRSANSNSHALIAPVDRVAGAWDKSWMVKPNPARGENAIPQPSPRRPSEASTRASLQPMHTYDPRASPRNTIPARMFSSQSANVTPVQNFRQSVGSVQNLSRSTSHLQGGYPQPRMRSRDQDLEGQLADE